MVSQTAEYALRAILCLAGQPQAALTTHRIAQATGVSPGYLAKILHQLGRSGLVHAQRGLHGGYTCARSPEQISILDVINAVSPLRRFEPRSLQPGPAIQPCAAVDRLNAAVDWVEQYLGRTTVRDLLTCRASCEAPASAACTARPDESQAPRVRGWLDPARPHVTDLEETAEDW